MLGPATLRLRIALAARGKKRRRKMPRARYPKSAEQDYLRELLDLIAVHRRIVERVLFPELASLVDQARAERGDSEITNLRNFASSRSPAWRADSWATRVRVLFEGFRKAFEPILKTDRLEALARRVGLNVSEANRKVLAAQMKAAIGVDLFAAEPQLAGRIEGFALENVALIKSIPVRLTDELEQRVLSSVTAGERAEDLAVEIRKRYDVTEKRAAVIARDQIGKLNGQLNKVRQEALGIRRYIWRTSNDERVRDSHAEMEGEICDWDDPPIVDGEAVHPGQAIMCRCTADPMVEELLEELEEEDE